MVAAIQKFIIWCTGIVVALLPIPLAVSENLTNAGLLFSLNAYLAYYGEIVFFSLSLSVMALFDSLELIAKCNKNEKALQTLFYLGFSVTLLHLIIGAIHFGNHTSSSISNYPAFYSLPVIILLSSLIKFIHSVRH